MTIDPKKVFEIKDLDTLKAKAFELMLMQENYSGFDLFITEIYYDGWALLLYKDKTNTLTLRYHDRSGGTQWKYFFSMGGCWHYIFEKILKIKVV